MIDRIFRSWKTTVIALAIMFACFVFVWFGKATMTEISGFLGTAFVVLFLKDKEVGL